MRRFTSAGRQAIENQNWYSGLTLALSLPDICASMEDPGTGKSKERYIKWCRRWLEPKYTIQTNGHRSSKPVTFFSAEDMFQARCSIIHSGSGEIHEKQRRQLDRFEFFSAGPHCNSVIGSVINGVEQPSFLQLNVEQFCEDVFVSVEEWDEASATNQAVQVAKAKLLVIREPGSVIGGIQFGCNAP